MSSTAVVTTESPLISIVIAAYNARASIQQVIESVRGQTYPNVECIVVDGGSTDGTVQMLRDLDGSIDRWVSEPDRGIYDAWNKGLAMAKGEWIGFLGVDDTYRNDAIERYVLEILKYSKGSIDYISSRADFVLPEWRECRTIGLPWSWGIFRRYMCVAHVGSLHNRRLFEAYGIYNTGYRIAGDYELLLRAREHLKAAFVDQITVTMHGGGISNRSLRAFEESRRAKVESGGCPPFTAFLEKYIAIGKYLARNIWERSRNVLARSMKGAN